MTRTLTDIANDMHIPVNPEYDFDRDSGVVDYVNPVLANNKLILFSNLLSELSVRNLTLQEKLDTARELQRAAEADLDKQRAAVLSAHEIPSAYTKNLALTDAFVRTKLREEGKAVLDAYETLEDQQRKAARTAERLQARIAATEQIAKRIEFSCENIKTHLSFVKKDMEWSGRG